MKYLVLLAVVAAASAQFKLPSISTKFLPCLEDGFVDNKLEDEPYVRAAMACMRDRNIPCPDQLANNVRSKSRAFSSESSDEEAFSKIN